MKKLLAPLLALFVVVSTSSICLLAFHAGSAYADTNSSAADQLHDPLDQPVQAYDDLVAARKLGWPIAIFAGGVMLARLLGALGKKSDVSWLAWLGVGKKAIAISGAAAVLAAAYNALATGGSYAAVGMAAVLAFASFWDSHASI
jgi:hypothetical protein